MNSKLLKKKKEAYVFIKENKYIFKKYKTIKQIGYGSFGNIYSVLRMKDKKYFAMKTENKSLVGKLSLESESYFLFILQGGFGIPKIITYGHSKNYNILIETLLGKSLFHIFLERSNECKITDLCLIGIQIIDRLEYIHSKDIVYRDVKPENFLIGIEQPNVIYIVDFGLCKKYRSSKTGKHILPKLTGKFNGTLKYASPNVVRGKESSRRDDLISVGYLLINLLKKKLPWQSTFKNLDTQKYNKLLNLKETNAHGSLFNDIPKELSEFIKYSRNLKFEQDPNYSYLRSLLIKIIENNKLNYKAITFSWIKNNDRELPGVPRNNSLRKVSPKVRLLKNLEEDRIKKKIITKSNSQINVIDMVDNFEILSEKNCPSKIEIFPNDTESIFLTKKNGIKIYSTPRLRKVPKQTNHSFNNIKKYLTTNNSKIGGKPEANSYNNLNNYLEIIYPKKEEKEKINPLININNYSAITCPKNVKNQLQNSYKSFNDIKKNSTTTTLYNNDKQDINNINNVRKKNNPFTRNNINYIYFKKNVEFNSFEKNINNTNINIYNKNINNINNMKHIKKEKNNKIQIIPIPHQKINIINNNLYNRINCQIFNNNNKNSRKSSENKTKYNKYLKIYNISPSNKIKNKYNLNNYVENKITQIDTKKNHLNINMKMNNSNNIIQNAKTKYHKLFTDKPQNINIDNYTFNNNHFKMKNKKDQYIICLNKKKNNDIERKKKEHFKENLTNEINIDKKIMNRNIESYLDFQTDYKFQDNYYI